MTDTARLRELATQATPGPWDVDEGTDTRPPVIVARDIDADDRGRAVHYKTEIATAGDTADDEANAAYIAAANPTAIISLLDELDAARARIAEVEGAIEEAARMAEQGILSADGGQAAVEIRSLIPLELRKARSDDWKDDPASDDRWNAGLDFAMDQLCSVLGVDPKSVVWDAATETVDGDVQSVMGNIFRKKYGEDWSPRQSPLPLPTEPPNDP